MDTKNSILKVELIQTEEGAVMIHKDGKITVSATPTGLCFNYFGDIEFKLHGKLKISTTGETNVVSMGGLNIDTLADITGKKIMLNSYMAEQIRDFEWAQTIRAEREKEYAENMEKLEQKCLCGENGDG